VGARSQVEAVQRIVEHLYEIFQDPETGLPGCVLVRCFQTHPFVALPAGLQEVARGLLAGEPSEELRCLALLGTRGDEAGWNRPGLV